VNSGPTPIHLGQTSDFRMELANHLAPPWLADAWRVFFCGNRIEEFLIVGDTLGFPSPLETAFAG